MEPSEGTGKRKEGWGRGIVGAKLGSGKTQEIGGAASRWSQARHRENAGGAGGVKKQQRR